MSDDIVARMKSWDRCWPGNTNVERLIDDAADEIERLRAAMSRCLLGDPPGDCYAAETVTLRARVAAFEKDISDAAGLLMVDVPEPGTPMAKVMQANAIMRWDRDAARARVAKLEAVQFAAKAYLDAALQHDSANAALAKRVAELEAERADVIDVTPPPAEPRPTRESVKPAAEPEPDPREGMSDEERERVEREADRLQRAEARGPVAEATLVPQKPDGSPDWLRWHTAVVGRLKTIDDAERAAFLEAHDPALANYAAASPQNAATLRNLIMGTD